MKKIVAVTEEIKLSGKRPTLAIIFHTAIAAITNK